MLSFDPVKIGIVSVSDRASTGVYIDKGLPALKDWLDKALLNPINFEERLIPDEQAGIGAALIELVDAGCALVLTTGGTGPALRDVTPEATLATFPFALSPLPPSSLSKEAISNDKVFARRRSKAHV